MGEAFITRRGGGGSADLNFRIVDSIDAPQSKSKNLIVYPYFHTTQTLNDLVFTDNGDGSVTVNGTASAMSHFRMSEKTVDSGMLYLDPGTYTLSGCPAGGSSTTEYMLQAWDAVNNVKIADDTGSGVTFTLQETTTVRVAIVVQSSTTCSGLVFWPQLEKGSAATNYAKYKQVENTIWLKSENLKEADVENYDFSAVQPFFRSNNKNLFCYPYYHANGHTSAGITYTDNGDGTVTAKGTATGTSIFRVSYGWEPDTNCIRLEPGTYTLSGCPAGGMDGSTYVVELYKVNPDGTENQRFAIDTGSGVTFTLEKAQLVRCNLVVYNGATVSGLVFKPMLEKGSTTTDFAAGDATGQVWISTAAASDMEFNALKKNGVQVYPIAVKQYISGAWEDTEAYIYQAGAWVELGGSLVLFDGDDGGDNTEVTGGWSTITAAGGTTTVTSSSIAFCANVSGTVRRAGTINAVDLSEYKTLYFDGVNNGTADSANYSFILLAERSNGATAVATVRQPFTTRGVVSIDLTAITSREAVYIAITNSSSSATSVLYRCWAE